MSILAALWNRLLASVTFLSSFVSSKIESLLDAASFRKIMEKKPNFADGEHQLSLNEGTVEFSNVSFSCPGSTDMVIENLNLHIRGGSKVGIVGESGAGKSTLCDLLMRQIRPINGEIKIDGQNINDLSTESNLSGGERQRIGIARLFLQRPHIALIDEGTSALDPETEGRIRQSINKVFENNTLVVIA
ncbi:hypothetical protein PMIN03_012256 [Paraphaeosphaeria minitans]